MSRKRIATLEINRDNWDDEMPKEKDEMGPFKIAQSDVLEKRVIRTVKRRNPISTEDESKKTVFTGFGGFKKQPPPSFDFLANLTNGNKVSNNTPTSNNGPASSNIFENKLLSGGSGGIFSTPVSKTPFETKTSQVSTSGSNLVTVPILTASKADSTTIDTPFKIKDTNNDSNTKSSNITFLQTSNETTTPSTMTTGSKSLFSSTSNSFPVKTQQVTSTVISTTNNLNSENNSNSTDVTKNEKKLTYYSKLKGLNESVSDWIKQHVDETPLCILTPIFKDYEKYLKEIQDEYHSSEENLTKTTKENSETVTSEKKQTSSLFSTTNLNTASVFATQTPASDVKNNTPISTNSSSSQETTTTNTGTGFTFGIKPSATPDTTSINKTSPFAASEKKPTSSLFSTTNSTTASVFSTQTPVSGVKNNSPISTYSSLSQETTTTNTGTGFTFGIKPTATPDTTSINKTPPFPTFGIQTSGSNSTTTPFPTFGIKVTSENTTTTNTSPFGFLSNKTTTEPTNSTPFSFGLGKPFSFSPNVQQPTETKAKEDDEEDEPPKVEFTPITEENSVYDKRCKLFIKKDGNFVDKGLGTVYIKKIAESNKHQLLVRANTNLGNVLLNLILNKDIPTQRMGKNNVMMVCIPSPDAKPTPVLIRVKTSEEADELLETLMKYKV